MRVPTPPDTLIVTGFFSPQTGKLTSAAFTAYFATRQEAAAFAARFPKSVRARTVTLSGAPGVAAFAEISLSFSPNKATGSKNDASIARYAAVLRAADKLGIRLVDGPQYALNQFPDVASIDRAVADLAKTPAAQLDRAIAEALGERNRR